MRRTSVLLALALLAPLALADRPDRDPGVASGKVRDKIAKDWIDLANWLTTASMKSEAVKALDQARAAEPDAKGLDAAQKAADAVADDKPADPGALTKRQKVATETAKLWEQVSDLQGGAYDEPIAGEGYARAAEIDPTKPRLAKQAEAAKKGIVLLKAAGHPMVAWLALPSDWKPGKEYPVLVAVEGAGANFVGHMLAFRNVRGSRSVILLVPYALSCTNALEPSKFPAYGKALLDASADQAKRIDFDVAGLLGLLDLVHDRFGGMKRVAITGFSGGGMLAYSFTLRKPDRIMLAAPACPNFSSAALTGAEPVPDGGPPVRIYTGGNDEYKDHVNDEIGIEGQTDRAVEALQKQGFKDVQRKQLPGVGHSPCVAQVWGALDEVTDRKR